METELEETVDEARLATPFEATFWKNGSDARSGGGANVFGTIFISDTEDPNAQLQSNGTNTVYGSVIVDGTLGSYTGTFQVVWNENIAVKAGGDGAVGSVLGGWADFHPNWQ